MSLLSVSVMARRLAQHDLSVYFANIYRINIYCVNVYNAFFTVYAYLRGPVIRRLPLAASASTNRTTEVLRQWFTARVLATRCSTCNVLD